MYISTGVKGIGSRLQELGYSNYKKYLKSPHWREFKNRVYTYLKDRNQFCCEFCRKSDLILHIHHKTYKRMGNERIGDVFLLCENCHFGIHKLEKQNKKLNLWKATKIYRKLLKRINT